MPFFDAALGLAATHKAAVLVAGPLLTAVAYVIYQLFVSSLAKVPGPFWAKISRLWITKHSWDGDMHRVVIELHKDHGNLVRTGPNEVSANLPKLVMEFF